jgi:hypothetical protein
MNCNLEPRASVTTNENVIATPGNSKGLGRNDVSHRLEIERCRFSEMMSTGVSELIEGQPVQPNTTHCLYSCTYIARSVDREALRECEKLAKYQKAGMIIKIINVACGGTTDNQLIARYTSQSGEEKVVLMRNTRTRNPHGRSEAWG